MVDGSVPELGRAKRKRKNRVIIHSSPFLRCVQTSIAIGAGIAQFKGRSTSPPKYPAMRSTSPHVHAPEDSPVLPGILEPAEHPTPAPSPAAPPSLPSELKPAQLATSTTGQVIQPKRYRVAELRIDPFLGEWLSPDYFENISPPPGSVMMVASAKADLLRPGETIEGAKPGRATHGNFPGGWSIDWSPGSSADESEEQTGCANVAALGHGLGHVLPHRNRSSTQGSDSSGSLASYRNPSKVNTNTVSSTANHELAYVPPIPTYAISPSDPIPTGYVAHARDACIDVSYQWDSMRAPQCWGDGGEYGEEWSSMHRRFRNGLAKMIEWYAEQDTEIDQTMDLVANPAEEEETDTVLILVTHGAGCNALLGALTNQPVLLDVGMASLTMAVRKSGTSKGPRGKREEEDGRKGAIPGIKSRRESVDLSIAADYEVKYTASTEHLRAGSNPLGGSPVSPRIGPAGSGSPYRRPTTSFSGDNFTIGESFATLSAGPSRPVTAGATLESGGMPPRSMNGHSAFRGLYLASRGLRTSGGLWKSGNEAGSGSKNEGESESGGESDSLPNFGRPHRSKAAAGGSWVKAKDGVDDVSRKTTDGNLAPVVQTEQLPSSQVNGNGTGNGNEDGARVLTTPNDLIKTVNRTASQKGLWGGGFTKDRDIPKRRWTVVENTAA